MKRVNVDEEFTIKWEIFWQKGLEFYKSNKVTYIAFNNTNEIPSPAIKDAFEMQQLLS
jgi:hypothetical protein